MFLTLIFSIYDIQVNFSIDFDSYILVFIHYIFLINIICTIVKNFYFRKRDAQQNIVYK